MKTTALTRWACTALFFASSFSASANSIGITDRDFTGTGQFTFSVYFDFTDFAMFGGGANILYDSSVLEFVSYTQAELPADAQAAASPIGQLESAGLYAGFGIGTFEFFNGMNSAGLFGEFVFNIIGDTMGSDYNGCGTSTPDYFTLEGFFCVTPNAINPFVSLAGDLVNEDIFTGPGAYIPPPQLVPVPAALWLLASAIGVTAGLRKKR